MVPDAVYKNVDGIIPKDFFIIVAGKCFEQFCNRSFLIEEVELKNFYFDVFSLILFAFFLIFAKVIIELFLKAFRRDFFWRGNKYSVFNRIPSSLPYILFVLRILYSRLQVNGEILQRQHFSKVICVPDNVGLKVKLLLSMSEYS